MDVTIDNFDIEYPKIVELLNKASFVSFDEEMTGITESGNRVNRRDDDPSARYMKMISIAERYSIIQFGMCIFIESDNSLLKDSTNASIEPECAEKLPSTTIVAYPYNFYLFPSSGRDIIMSASAIEFLKKNNLDFNTWITKGVNYCNEDDDTWASQKYISPIITAQQDQSSNGTVPEPKKRIILTKQSDIDFINSNLTRLNDYISANEAAWNDAKPFEFESCNSYLRRVIYESIEDNYSNISLTPSPLKQGALQATYVSLDGMKELQAQKVLDSYSNYYRVVGFRRLFKDLVASKVPIVGHNCMYDLMFMLKAFVGPLPSTLDSFKDHLSKFFPCVLDTKYLFSSGCLGVTLSDTTLSDLHTYSKEHQTVDIIIPDEFDVSEEKLHNAGYDAYITGYSFAQLWKLKAIKLEDILSSHGNRLFMMQSLYHMDLTIGHPNGIIKATGLLIHLTCPTTANNSDIVDIFLSSGLTREEIDLMWIDGTSLIVEVNPSKPETTVFSVISSITNTDYIAQDYWAWKEQKNVPNIQENEAVVGEKRNLDSDICANDLAFKALKTT